MDHVGTLIPTGFPVADEVEPKYQPVKRLLTKGNTKLGRHIMAWSIPNITTCPGRTALCEKLCYVSKYMGRYKLDYTPRLEATKRSDFVDRMVEEAGWAKVVRVHVSGDFHSMEYIRKWVAIGKRCSGTRFFVYTRSWRVPELLPALRKLEALRNFTVNWSADRQTGIPEHPLVMYMSVDDNDVPFRPVKIVFRVKHTKVKAKMGGSIVCPKENGIKNKVTCGRCQLCF